MTIIRWLGQACFLLITLGGAQVLIDPPNPSVGYHVAAHSIPADLVLVSHSHPDHNYVQAAASTERGAPQIVSPLPLQTGDAIKVVDGSYTYGSHALPADNVHFVRVSAFHDNVQGKERGADTLTLIESGGLRIVHMGDIGQLTLTQDQIDALGRVDVLMLPVGGFFTVDGTQAPALIEQLHPRVIIPMHDRTQMLKADLKTKLAPVDVFLLAMRGKAEVIHAKARDLKLSPATLPKKQTIYVLRYQ